MTIYRSIFAVLACLGVGAVYAGDMSATIEDCNGCHGDKGVSKWSDVPTISGISESVLADALFIYRDEERPCEESKYRQGDTARAATTMCKVAMGLSDEQIDELAIHYSELPFVPAKQEFDEALAEAGQAVHEQHCDRCHSEGGSLADDEASILAGQQMGYMQRMFAEYRSAKRDQPKKMKEKLDALSDADVAALLNYYASQQ